jgi:hypothetical protein
MGKISRPAARRRHSVHAARRRKARESAPIDAEFRVVARLLADGRSLDDPEIKKAVAKLAAAAGLSIGAIEQTLDALVAAVNAGVADDAGRIEVEVEVEVAGLTRPTVGRSPAGSEVGR